MKKILILILLPTLCSAQVILENVTKMCYLDKSIKKEECTDILSGMSIYIENDILCIKSEIDYSEYEIDSYYEDELGNRVGTFDIIIENKINTATIFEDNIYKVIFIHDDYNNKVTEFYSRKKL